jgi:hypothetical protein
MAAEVAGVNRYCLVDTLEEDYARVEKAIRFIETQALRQPGSAFKPFTYTVAVMRGMPPTRLRDLREKRLVPRSLGWINLPRLSHVLPVMCAVGCALALFFLLKDLGPALVTGFLFLALFWVARGRAGLALLGIVLLVAGVTIGYKLGKPTTVVERIDMWLSPWDNDVHGGNQLAHSLWAFATGGTWGSGPGWGDPAMIPAGNTDLVLPAIGEEWGFAGVAAVLLLLGYLVHRALRIGLRAANEYGLFLALGLGALIAFEMLLISGGVLGAIPLSGVVSPFLSSGNTAMLANFLIFGILLAISKHARPRGEEEPFRPPVRNLERALGLCAVVLLSMAAYYQVLRDRDYLARDTKVFEDDGVKRAQHNPRMNSIAREIPRGGIYDRNGIPLATGSCSRPAIGMNSRSIGRITPSWAFRSTAPARAWIAGIILSAR